MMYDIKEAEEKGLIQLTIWLKDRKCHREYLDRCEQQVLLNKGRVAMKVKKGGLVALFVDEAGKRY